ACSLGIRTEPDDVESVLAYFVDGEEVPAGDIQHRKGNVDANVKRGIPLFYPVQKNLRRAEKLLRNMSVVAEIQSAIALIRRHRGGTASGVQRFVGEQADVTRESPGAVTHYSRYAPGTIIDAQAGIEYDFPAAAIDAGKYVLVLQAELRAIASRLVMPEFMLSSDASNANYSSTLVAEGPAVKMFERLQAEQIADDLELIWRAVERAIAAGRLDPQTRDAVEIQVEPPSLGVRNLLEETQVRAVEFQHGLLSLQTWSQRAGLDYDQEQANIRARQAASGAAPE
ncbi:MAG: phage portal protein, partial [Planctomycetaceae bacterium]|nr:phage portal protein [Planctomycetaceae bacterium]